MTKNALITIKDVSKSNFILDNQFGCPKTCPEKKKINKFWKLPCLPLRKKFLESFQFAPIENPFNSKCGKKISRLPQQDKKMR